MAKRGSGDLRLADKIPHAPRVLFVGINPGMRSARLDHHYAGHSNRFWKLLYESGLTPVRLRAEDDARVMEWGYGLTNLVPRATPGMDTLRRDEFTRGLRVLRRKVRRLRPPVVAFVGVTLFRVVFGLRPNEGIRPGLQAVRFEGAAVVVLPNPSGRNAHFSHAEMLCAYRELAVYVTRGVAASAS